MSGFTCSTPYTISITYYSFSRGEVTLCLSHAHKNMTISPHVYLYHFFSIVKTQPKRDSTKKGPPWVLFTLSPNSNNMESIPSNIAYFHARKSIWISICTIIFNFFCLCKLIPKKVSGAFISLSFSLKSLYI